MNYDPTIGAAVQRVRLQYAQLDHRLQVEVDVTGSYRGLEVMEWALELHYEQLDVAAGENPARLALVNDAGELLLLVDDALLGVEWLKDMLVAAEILSIEPLPTVAGAPATPFSGLGARPSAANEPLPRPVVRTSGAIGTGETQTARMRFALAELGPRTARELAALVGLPTTALVGALLKHDVSKGRVVFRNGRYHAVALATEAAS